jgi:hypothetical protein
MPFDLPFLLLSSIPSYVSPRSPLSGPTPLLFHDGKCIFSLLNEWSMASSGRSLYIGRSFVAHPLPSIAD